MKKKIRLVSLVALLALLVTGISCFINSQRTKVGFVNFGDMYLAELVQAKDNFWITVGNIDLEKSTFAECSNYNLILLNHLGRLTPEQSDNLQKCMDKGVQVHVTMATSKEYEISTLGDSAWQELRPYLSAVGAENEFRFLNYVRRNIHGKTAFTVPVEAPTPAKRNVFFRLGSDYYEDFAAYEKFYAGAELHKKDAPYILITAAGVYPQNTYRDHIDSLILNLETRGYNVVAMGGTMTNLELMQQVQPAAVINFAHGRLDMRRSEAGAKWLQQNNILYFTPLLVHSTRAEWEKDKRGMSGGIMGQNIVVPEIDGAIGAYVVASQEVNHTGFAVPKAMSDRMGKFVQVVDSWLKLRTQNPADKKIAIYYIKSMGKNAMVAGGLEVGKSLHNVLVELKKAGLKVDNLPSTPDQLLELIQKHGSLYDPHENPGIYREYMQQANPLLVRPQELAQWMRDEIPDSLIKLTQQHYGPIPGDHYVLKHQDSTVIAIPYLQFGNVVLTPIMPAALGVSEFAMTHGVNVPPPYSYIASYLWARKGFKADAIVHFGAHGSVEFIPGKQVALSSDDWAEVLTAPQPHLYIYSIDNIGEAMMAKRRTYATMVSHLTPAMAEADILDGPTKRLQDYIKGALSTADSMTFDMARRKAYHLLDSMGLKVDLGWQGLEYADFNLDKINDMENYLEHLGNERISTGLHTFGKSYSQSRIEETVLQMSWPPVQSALEVTSAQARKIVREIFYGADPAKYVPQNFAGNKEELLAELNNIKIYRANLEKSGPDEVAGIVQGASGALVPPGPGGDVVGNPNAAPTGKNLYGIDAETTPNALQWEIGKKIAGEILAKHLRDHGEYPQKIAYSLWGGEFIRNQGMEVAQILYLIGAEPVRNARGRVYDVKLIPASELGRPRIDVVVQTSGQFRDIGGSRIALIQKAIALASEDATENNFVRHGTLESEKELKQLGVAPVEARRLSGYRVFGGLNGSYGTGIMGMVENGESWDSTAQLANQYINNMNSLYTDDEWGNSYDHLLKTQLARTDVVVHPRSSNATGPISLDHVYEFMGGISAAIKEVTGKDPKGYFSDNRNRHNAKVQGLEEAIWTEVRSTMLNSKFLNEALVEGPSALEGIAENFRNTYGWNALKESAIDSSLWNAYYAVFLKDSLNINLPERFEAMNPYALQEMTGVMLETIRKGLWEPDSSVKNSIARRHAELIERNDAGCSEFVCGNAKLIDYIAQTLQGAAAEAYQAKIAEVKKVAAAEAAQQKVVLEQKNKAQSLQANRPLAALVLLAVVIVGLVLVVFRSKRKN